ncbi:MAG: DNA mismatch repair endonuclease MutL [Methanocalculus sp. MSAO_Arc2]|uniref:DNA mismatch repair endonuclease MutL n=1 Tax=Methanocalculus sp. MSAO_Arc2 TaxID=2293855 RepID=UPI000FF30167|nr:MAG: DNA mismatch repair endonuclease MutL [Methanocalculus sp. MSAO_Arc2]
MTMIHILDEETVSHIAAGEVVERPASVVKELVENAIDASAQRIRVEIRSDGSFVRKMTVSDDGTGMTADDASLAFRQHATSKIRSADDLLEVATLGFRGEALASIAAVSEVVLTTRRKDDLVGTRLHLSGGVVTRASETGAPPGTTISVSDLFFNTPARRKFLRTVSTELAHIFDLMERIALSHPEISFTLIHQEKEKFTTSGREDLVETIQEIFGSDLARRLIPIVPVQGGLMVTGYLAYPLPVHRSGRSTYLSVNGRQIISQPLVRAIREGFGTSLPKDRFPFAVLDIRLDPGEIDVNVHPTKREVRFRKERDVIDSLRKTVWSTLSDPMTAPGGATAIEKGAVGLKKRHLHTRVAEGAASYPGMDAGEPEFSKRDYERSDHKLRQTELADVPAGTETTSPHVRRVLGQVHGTYILAEGEDGDLLIIDQHAAHEKIVFDALMKKREGVVSSQHLLVPVMVQLSHRDAALVRDASGDLHAAGFVIEPFGGDSWAVQAVPAAGWKMDDPDDIQSLLLEVIEGIRGPATDRQMRVCMTIACRTAIKGSTLLSQEQMERLISQLLYAGPPFTCPHGRPALARFTDVDLGHLFQRR